MTTKHSRRQADAGQASSSANAQVAQADFSDSQDFIAFDFDESEDENNESNDVKQDDTRQAIASSSSSSSNKLSKSKNDQAKGKKRKFNSIDDKRDGQDTKRPGSSRRGEPYSTPATRKRERREAAIGTPWCEEVDFTRCSNAVEMLHDELIAFAEWMTPSPQEHEAREMIISLIGRAIVREWHDARVEAFGSQNTQLYMPHGDVDLVVVSPSMEAQRREHVLRKMAVVLRRHNLATDVQVIAKAKVPIVKFVCTYGKLKVDISINQVNGIQASSFVHGWLDKCPSIRPLIMVTKLFLSQRGLSEVFSGGLGSYSVICLVISHLQMHPKVQRGELDPALNLGSLFLDFLELYGKNFGYDNVGISVRGRGSYFPKVQRGWRDERRAFMLSIEDPLDPLNDISKGSFGIIQVRSALAGAYDILTATICQRGNEQMQARARQHWQYDEDEEARRAIVNEAQNGGFGVDASKDQQSLLGTIVGISRDMLKQKRDLEQLWQSGALQHKLGRSPPARSPEPASGVSTPNLAESDAASKAPQRGSKRQKSDQAPDERTSTTTGRPMDVSRGNAARAGSSEKPIVVYDSSDPPRASQPSKELDRDSPEMLNEEELAASQGIQFASMSSGTSQTSDLRGKSGSQKENIEDDSRYTNVNVESRRKGGRENERQGLTRFDVFAERAPKRFVDDDESRLSDSGSDSEATSDEKVAGHRRNGAKAARGVTTLSSKKTKTSNGAALARRERKNAFWASKGNAVNGRSAPLSDDDDDADDGSSSAGDDDAQVMLNIYD